MNWTINPEPVCGGISIIDEDGRGVAIVIQRDPHPTLGQGVTLEEAERRARVMTVSLELLAVLERCRDELQAMKSEIGFRANTLNVIGSTNQIIARARGEE